ncbi:MAG: nicotinate-nucleotide adenylyltransferase [Gammaproteobacteria bacterium]|nr:nicotinate-nucleotide adenylyltransferase [Gammaproteobacteria bacterium]MDP2141939.1 nicotinate-nucleotide adenylyltransferase [Gammaproteobacteria bacterium]MDP2347179.1 nicotinate-nucleotide adenylyltransferase [Gammaproteobacteria bacterium]
MRKIGVMGGMFDPVHRGHLAVATEALNVLDLDELRMVPCHLPSHRGPAAASAQDRVAMLRLATEYDRRLLIDERECFRFGVSYTVDTLEALRREFSQDSLVLVMGADAFRGLAGWHCWQQIPQLAHIAVVSRPGVLNEIPDACASELQGRQVACAEQLFAARKGKLIMLSNLQLEISSTLVREKLESHDAIDTLLPDAVAGYIKVHGLYRAVG